MRRPAFVRGLAGGLAVASSASIRVARAQSYPSRPIILIVPWGPGGGVDQVGRAVAQILQDHLKVSVPVINISGADGNNGMVKLLNSEADGYTIAALASDTFYGNIVSKTGALWQLSGITPLAMMNSQPFTFFAAANGPYRSWADVSKVASIKPVRVAINSFGDAEDVLIRYFTARGLKFVGVPFPPTERYAALLGNQVDFMIDPDGNVTRYIESKQMVPLAVFSNKRVSQMPNVPTAFELGYTIAVGEWRALVAKTGTNPEQLKVLSDALVAVYKSAEFQAFLKQTWSEDSFVAYKDMPAFLRTKDQEFRKLLASTH